MFLLSYSGVDKSHKQVCKQQQQQKKQQTNSQNVPASTFASNLNVREKTHFLWYRRINAFNHTTPKFLQLPSLLHYI